MQVDGNYNHPTCRASLCFLKTRALGWSGVKADAKKKKKSQMGMFKLYVHDTTDYDLSDQVAMTCQLNGFRAATDKNLQSESSISFASNSSYSNSIFFTAAKCS